MALCSIKDTCFSLIVWVLTWKNYDPTFGGPGRPPLCAYIKSAEFWDTWLETSSSEHMRGGVLTNTGGTRTCDGSRMNVWYIRPTITELYYHISGCCRVATQPNYHLHNIEPVPWHDWRNMQQCFWQCSPEYFTVLHVQTSYCMFFQSRQCTGSCIMQMIIGLSGNSTTAT